MSGLDQGGQGCRLLAAPFAVIVQAHTIADTSAYGSLAYQKLRLKLMQVETVISVCSTLVARLDRRDIRFFTNAVTPQMQGLHSLSSECKFSNQKV